MMKATELRIGNLVYIGSEINKIELVDFADIYENNTIILYQPIPLTEEWLVKLGFERGGQSTLSEYFVNVREWNNFYFSKIGLGTIAKIQYVHQLQNLYFALTGEAD